MGQAGLRAVVHPPGAPGVRDLLTTRRCIQLDPLNRIGTNADLVAMARVDGLKMGDVYRHLLPGHAFEHFAKERCLLPASAFPAYRDQAVETPWWRSSERMQRLPTAVVEAVEAEITARGALTVRELADHGAVEAIDWHGWKSTSKATTMAMEVLWRQCRTVVCGRTSGGKRFDLPGRALPGVAQAAPPASFGRWATLERVEAAGLLALASGPWWSMLQDVRRSELPAQLVAEGAVEAVQIEGARRLYLAPAGFRDRCFPDDDGRLRILGPLDPLIWDRKLVHQVFGFEYVWEVYKPAAKRRWGWYVVPLLHDGRLVGRLDGRVHDGELVVEQLWDEGLDPVALDAALARHQLGISGS